MPAAMAIVAEHWLRYSRLRGGGWQAVAADDERRRAVTAAA